jgi:hypothetical protein
MWTEEIENLEQSEVIKYRILHGEKVLSFQEFIDLLISSEKFRLYFNELLVTNKFNAYFFEVKPISINSIAQDFEFVLVNSISLSKIKSDNSAFIQHLSTLEPVVSFYNLNKDALLIVPNELSNIKYYAHLALFVRNATINQINKFWQTVGIKYQQSIKDKPIWLSTSGLGVYWLHMRIDTKPKYYSYSKYKVINL